MGTTSSHCHSSYSLMYEIYDDDDGKSLSFLGPRSGFHKHQAKSSVLAEEGLSTEPSAGCPPGSGHVSAPQSFCVPCLDFLVSYPEKTPLPNTPSHFTPLDLFPGSQVHLMVSCLNCFRHCVSSRQLDWLSNLRSYGSRGSHKLLVQQVLLDKRLTIASLWQA